METRKKTGRKIVDVAVRGCSLVATVLALALMGWILWTVVREGAGALSWDLLIHRSRPYGEPGGGIANALVGTLVITLGAAALAIPLALLAGIGLAEFGGKGRFTGICRFAINLLMGVPSVIVGLFVYGVLVVPTGHFSGFAGSVALAMLMFAVAVRTTEDQIALVPTALREAGLALGASRMRVTLGLVCRDAARGMLTGILLAVARVAGETAPLLFTALYADDWPTNYFGGPTPSIPVLIANNTLDSPFEEVQRVGWSAALVIAGAILALNVAVRFFARAGKGVREGERKDFMEKRYKIRTKGLNFFYGDRQALFGNDLAVEANKITAVIGPSGCGKSTHLRVYNRIFELHRGQCAEGEVLLDGKNVLDPDVDLLDLRRRVGMIFQKPTPFPMSVYDNVAYPVRLHFKATRRELDDRVEEALRGAALWDEVKDKLREPGTALSGGQQQRLCIARAIAAQPEVLLMDEPTSAIDPVGTLKIEELMDRLRRTFTIVIVTHNMQQASRISDVTAFFYRGRIVEVGPTKQIFQNPKNKQTEDYVSGRFG